MAKCEYPLGCDKSGDWEMDGIKYCQIHLAKIMKLKEREV